MKLFELCAYNAIEIFAYKIYFIIMKDQCAQSANEAIYVAVVAVGGVALSTQLVHLSHLCRVCYIGINCNLCLHNAVRLLWVKSCPVQLQIRRETTNKKKLK